MSAEGPSNNVVELPRARLLGKDKNPLDRFELMSLLLAGEDPEVALTADELRELNELVQAQTKDLRGEDKSLEELMAPHHIRRVQHKIQVTLGGGIIGFDPSSGLWTDL